MQYVSKQEGEYEIYYLAETCNTVFPQLIHLGTIIVTSKIILFCTQMKYFSSKAMPTYDMDYSFHT